MQPQSPVPGSNGVTPTLPTPSHDNVVAPPMSAATPPASMPPVMPSPLAVAETPNDPPLAAPAAPPAAATPNVAEDGDRLEKVWAEQAERVLREMAGNPYEQLQAFTNLKAEYLQKRYGKQLKVKD